MNSSTNWSKVYQLNNENIDKYVKDKSIGNYLLGYKSNQKFMVEYVGRSDTNLNSRLKDWVDKGYKEFRFLYAKDDVAAYYEECCNFHDFKNDINQNHPAKPKGNDKVKCPVPYCIDLGFIS